MSISVGVFKPNEQFIKSLTGNLTKEHINWRYSLGMTIKGKRHNAYRDNNLSIQKEDYHGKTTWWIDGDEREFKSLDEMLLALNEKIVPIWASLQHDAET